MTTRVSRRTLGALALGLAAAGAAIVELPRFMRRRYPATPYDDLLSQIGDRDAAARVGSAVRKIRILDPKAIAAALRIRLAGRPLEQLIEEDARQGRVSLVGGWVLPDAVAQIGAVALAARKA